MPGIKSVNHVELKEVETRNLAPPVLVNNTLTIEVNGTVILSSENLAATDPDSDESLLYFNITDVQHGQFEFVTDPSIPIDIFYQQNITDQTVQFRHDGSFVAPIYRVSVSDDEFMTAPAYAEIRFFGQGLFPAALELSSLDGRSGFVLNGVAANDQSGISVSAAGDINGDGISDLIIGAPTVDPAGRLNAGASYVVFGGSTVGSSGVMELSSLNGSNGFVLNGVAAGDQSGLYVSSAGDINGDGIDDLIIGAYYADPSGRTDAGASYVVFGGSTVGASGVIELPSLNGINGFVLNGVAVGDQSGRSRAAGDINGDGINDLIIGGYKADPAGRTEAGASYVVFGGVTVGSTGAIELSGLNGTSGFVLNGAMAGDHSGFSVNFAGDINGDGISDLIIGAPNADPSGRAAAGASYVVFGGSTVGSSGVIELSSLNGINGFVLNGVNEVGWDVSGISVSAVGDINADGISDFIVGAYLTDSAGRIDAGASYVVFGGSTVGSTGVIELSSLEGVNGFVLNGVAAGDESGISVRAAGDINADGIDDLIIGARQADPAGRTGAGASYVVFGGETVGSSGVMELSSLDGTTGFVLNGVAAGDWSGQSVSAAGDINADGIDDLIIGAYLADPSGRIDAGASYVVFGRSRNFSPHLGNHTLSVREGETQLLTLEDFSATDPDDGEGQLIFRVSDVQHGQFELVHQPTVAINQFYQQNITQVQFVHDGGEIAPSFKVSVSDGILSTSAISAEIVFTNVNDLPILVNNTLTLNQGARVVFTPTELSATDVETSEVDLLFNVTGIRHGYFDFVSYPETEISVFYQQNITDNEVRFTHDGSKKAPAYYISVSDGELNTVALRSAIHFSVNPVSVNQIPRPAFPPVIELSSLNVKNGFTLNGAAAGDWSGFSVSSAGDINGDGIDDLIIGAYEADPFGRDRAGTSCVVFGEEPVGSSGVIELSSLDGTNGFVLNGVAAEDYSGISVSRAGDVNADGIDDLFIGSRGDPAGRTDAGASYVVFGGETVGSSGVMELSSLDGTTGFVLNGVALDDWSGRSVSAAGDVNADGIDDLIIGACKANPSGRTDAGASYVVFGRETVWSSGVIELSSLNGTNGFVLNGVASWDLSGLPVSAAGDINGDGIDDLIIGAYGVNPFGRADAGASYVVFGGSAVGSSGVIELSSLNGTNGFVLNGVSPGDWSGRRVSSAGDINGDGICDLIIGALYADPAGRIDAGASYVVFGGSTVGSSGVIELSSLNGTNGFVLNGIAAGDESGYSVSGALDINGDGISDLIIGAHRAGPSGRTDAGASYVVFGDIPPELHAHQLTIAEGESIVLSSAHFNATDANHPDTALTFTISGLDHGQFAFIYEPEVSMTQFSQFNITQGSVRFTHDGGEFAPVYNITLSDGMLVMPAVPATIDFTNVNDAPVLVNHTLTVNEGQTVVLTTNDFSATDVDAAAGTLIFVVSDVTQGRFEFITNSGVAITQFTQQQISGGQVQFVHDGGEIAPSFNVSVSDGELSTAPVPAVIDFTSVNDAPVMVNKQLTINEAQSLVLMPNDILAFDPDNFSSELIFTVQNVYQGRFELTLNPGMPITQFTQQQIMEGRIQFAHTGSIAPNFEIKVSDGELSTVFEAGIIDFDYAPHLEYAQLTIMEGQTIVLSSEELSATDPDNTPDELQFIVTNLAHGQWTGNGSVTTTFSQQDVDDGAIQFTHDGGEIAPSFTVRVSDGRMSTVAQAASISFIPTNDAPVLTSSLVGDVTYVENAIPLVIDSGLVITDADHEQLTGATVMIAENLSPEEDALIFQDQSGIVGNYDPNTGILSLLGETTLPNYQTALQSVKYENLSEDPSTLVRTIRFTVNDGLMSSDPVDIRLIVEAVNDKPEVPPGLPDFLNSATMTRILQGGSGGIAAGLIGLGFWRYRKYLNEKDTRKAHPFADSLRKELKMVGVDDFTSDAGKRFVRIIDEIVVRLRTKGVNVLEMAVDEREFYARRMARTIESKVQKERQSSCLGKERITIMHIQSRIKEVVEDLLQQGGGEMQRSRSDVPLRAVEGRGRSGTDAVRKVLRDDLLTTRYPTSLAETEVGLADMVGTNSGEAVVTTDLRSMSLRGI